MIVSEYQAISLCSLFAYQATYYLGPIYELSEDHHDGRLQSTTYISNCIHNEALNRRKTHQQEASVSLNVPGGLLM